MKKSLILISVLLLNGILGGFAQTNVTLPDASSKLPFLSKPSGGGSTAVPDPAAGTRAPDNRMEWWRDARFGMFIHWGLYAVPAGAWNGKAEYGEWIRTSAQIPLDVYDQFREKFNPTLFDADAWVKLAREAGMKYIVITSKHHDGFCMFDTKQTDFCIMKTPFARDPMKELAAACRKYGLKFCFYHSIMDWHHPDYLPRRDWEKDRTTAGADYDRYVSYMKAQLKELLTNYGDIGVLWFDGEWESTWNETFGKDLYYYVRSLQPSILINNRVGAGRLDMEGLTKEGAFGGDFGTPEQQIPATGLPGVDWETCMTMNDHWGYNKADKNFKSTTEIIHMLADIASKGGNYLLNVGPTAEGLIPPESVERLKAIGKWMDANSESVYGTSASPFRQLSWGRCTRKQTANGTILYLHVFKWPVNGQLVLSGVLNTPVKAYLLADVKRKALVVRRKSDALLITLPPKAPDTIDAVVALELQGKLDMTAPPEFKPVVATFVDSLPVVISSDRDHVTIRYSLGPVDPDVTSTLYSGPLMLHSTTSIRARCFREGKPVSGTSTLEFKKVVPFPPVSKVGPLEAGLKYQYYEGEFDSLPDFRIKKPVKEGFVSDFVFTPRNQPDNFAFVYEGLIRLPENSVYTFYTNSDDGSRLWIDSHPVVNNDGLHGSQEKQGDIALAKGLHRIRVACFDRTGGDNLSVFLSNQYRTRAILPASWLFHE